MIIIQGVKYNSCKEAAKATGINAEVLQNRKGRGLADSEMLRPVEKRTRRKE